MRDVLTADQIERFVLDGFVRHPEAFPRSLAEQCRAFLWRETGLDLDDPVRSFREDVTQFLGGEG